MKKWLAAMAMLWSGTASSALLQVVVGYGTVYNNDETPSRQAAGDEYTIRFKEMLARSDIRLVLPKSSSRFVRGDYHYVEGGQRYEYLSNIPSHPRTNQVGERELDVVSLDGDFLARPRAGVMAEDARARFAQACEQLRGRAAAAYRSRADKKLVADPYDEAGKPGFCVTVEVTGAQPQRMFHLFEVERIVAGVAPEVAKVQTAKTGGAAVVPKLVLGSTSTKDEDEANARLEADRRKAAQDELRQRQALALKLAEEERATKAYAETLKKQGRVVTLPQYADYLEEHQAKTWCDRQMAEIPKGFEKSRNQLISIGACGCKPGGSGVNFTKEYRCEVMVTFREFHTPAR